MTCKVALLASRFDGSPIHHHYLSNIIYSSPERETVRSSSQRHVQTEGSQSDWHPSENMFRLVSHTSLLSFHPLLWWVCNVESIHHACYYLLRGLNYKHLNRTEQVLTVPHETGGIKSQILLLTFYAIDQRSNMQILWWSASYFPVVGQWIPEQVYVM